MHDAQVFGHDYGDLRLWKVIQDVKIQMGTILQVGSTLLKFNPQILISQLLKATFRFKIHSKNRHNYRFVIWYYGISKNFGH